MKSLTCPHCSGTMMVDDDKDVLQCPYCGYQMSSIDKNTKHTYRKIDEARIKEAELEDRRVSLEIVMAKENAKTTRVGIVVYILAMFVISLITIYGRPSDQIYGLMALITIAIGGSVAISKILRKSNPKTPED